MQKRISVGLTAKKNATNLWDHLLYNHKIQYRKDSLNAPTF